jgi:hypothetical protein
MSIWFTCTTSFSIRQHNSDTAFRRAIASLNSKALHSPAKLLQYSVDDSLEYPILATVDMGGIVTQVRR